MKRSGVDEASRVKRKRLEYMNDHRLNFLAMEASGTNGAQVGKVELNVWISR
jgi:hypothetical protein